MFCYGVTYDFDFLQIPGILEPAGRYDLSPAACFTEEVTISECEIEFHFVFMEIRVLRPTVFTVTEKQKKLIRRIGIDVLVGVNYELLLPFWLFCTIRPCALKKIILVRVKDKLVERCLIWLRRNWGKIVGIGTRDSNYFIFSNLYILIISTELIE